MPWISRQSMERNLCNLCFKQSHCFLQQTSFHFCGVFLVVPLAIIDDQYRVLLKSDIKDYFGHPRLLTCFIMLCRKYMRFICPIFWDISAELWILKAFSRQTPLFQQPKLQKNPLVVHDQSVFSSLSSCLMICEFWCSWTNMKAFTTEPDEHQGFNYQA